MVTTNENVEAPLTQLELIKQWRTTLAFLMKDIKFDSMRLAENEKNSSVLESIEYLDKKNALLDENDDFQLSGTGFSTYKIKHMQVFDYLSNLSKHAVLHTNSNFYFFSISKHIKQQRVPSCWKHSLKHFLFIPTIVVALIITGYCVVQQTQYNSIVNILLFWFCSIHLSVANKLLKPFKKTAATPFKFRVSLLGIYSLNTLLKVILIFFIPTILTFIFQPYWVDDIIIISLFVLCLFHYKPEEEPNVKNFTESEQANV